MATSGVEQSIEVLRRADEDNRARQAELATLRHQLAELHRALASAEDAKGRLRNEASSLATELDRKQHALDIVLKELLSTKEALNNARADAARLRELLDRAAQHSRESGALLAAKSQERVEELTAASAPHVTYLQHCLGLGVPPHVGLLQALHAGGPLLSAAGSGSAGGGRGGSPTASVASGPGLLDVSVSAQPATATTPPADGADVTFAQLGALGDVIAATLERGPAHALAGFAAVDLPVDRGAHAVVCDLVRALPNVVDVTFRRVDDASAPAVEALLATCERITSVALPDLAVTGDGAQKLLRCLHHRNTLAADRAGDATVGATAPLTLHRLELGRCKGIDAPTLGMVRHQALQALDLSGAAVDDAALRGILDVGKAVVYLKLTGNANAGGVTGKGLSAILNNAPLLSTLDVTGCTALSQLSLQHVVELRTDLNGITFLDCPRVVALPTPATYFQVVEWRMPALERLALQGVSLSQREFGLLSQSPNLTHAHLVNCRVLSLETLTKRLRKLVSLSLHGTKGVQDVDVIALCSTLETVDMTDCYALTDRAIARLGQCPRLRELSLKRCANVTDDGIHCLDPLEHLSYLNVLGCKRVTVLSLHRLIDRASALRHVVHETILNAEITVERNDMEELEKRSLAQAELDLAQRRVWISVAHGTAPPASRPGTSESVGRRDYSVGGGGSVAGASVTSPSPRKVPGPPGVGDL